MTSLPRILTIDPTGSASRLLRAAVDLIGMPATIIDVAHPALVVDEIERGALELVVTALALDDSMTGFDLAHHLKETRPETSVIVICSEFDAPIDDDTRAASPFLILQRPFDAAVFARAVMAGMEGRDVLTAQHDSSPRTVIAAPQDIGAIPHIDLKAATAIIDNLMGEVNALSLMLFNRDGDILLQRGAGMEIDPTDLAHSLLHSILTTFEMGHLVGGRPSAVTFYDGDQYDVYVLSVGLHYLLTLVWDGVNGRSQFGAVNRYGRRAAEDLVAMIGASAFMVEAERQERATMEMRRAAEIAAQTEPEIPVVYTPPPVEEKRRGRRKGTDPLAEPARRSSEPLILRSDEIEQVRLPEPEPLRLDPLLELNPDLLDPRLLDTLNVDADDLFDMDKLTDIAAETRRERGPLSYDEARELGIIP
jgi:DNA-binding NarL/FixJ family response regulator